MIAVVEIKDIIQLTDDLSFISRLTPGKMYRILWRDNVGGDPSEQNHYYTDTQMVGASFYESVIDNDWDNLQFIECDDEGYFVLLEIRIKTDLTAECEEVSYPVLTLHPTKIENY